MNNDITVLRLKFDQKYQITHSGEQERYGCLLCFKYLNIYLSKR